jgi:hypothetical protein
MNTRRTMSLVLLVIAVLLGGCSPASGPTYPVGGRAVAGPVCPVERIPPDPACAPRPVSGAVMVITGDGGREVTRASTDADGRWRAELLAGSYTLTPQPVDGLMGTPGPIEFTVTASGSPGDLDVAYDTGIR